MPFAKVTDLPVLCDAFVLMKTEEHFLEQTLVQHGSFAVFGADAVGINCSTGPEQMAELVREMKAYANIPNIAKPMTACRK